MYIGSAFSISVLRGDGCQTFVTCDTRVTREKFRKFDPLDALQDRGQTSYGHRFHSCPDGTTLPAAATHRTGGSERPQQNWIDLTLLERENRVDICIVKESVPWRRYL
jgi:hypothetical protein